VSWAGRAPVIAHVRGRLAAVGAGVLVVALLFSALEPSSARAWLLGLPSPGQVVSGLLGGIGDVIGGTVGKAAVTAFDAIIHALFSPIARFINFESDSGVPEVHEITSHDFPIDNGWAPYVDLLGWGLVGFATDNLK